MTEQNQGIEIDRVAKIIGMKEINIDILLEENKKLKAELEVLRKAMEEKE